MSQTTVLTSAASTIANLNPFRYRSYYYDTETSLYFLKTRYYDPEIGRFMTIDDLSYLDPDSINGLNLYAYCGDNPVNCVDCNGTFVITTAFIIGLIAGAVIGGTVGGVVTYNNASASGATGWSLVGQTALGVLGGAVVGAAIGGLIGAAAPYIGGFLSTSFPILVPVMMDGVVGYTVVATVTGAQIAGGAIAVGLGITLFSKHNPKMTNKPPYTWVNQQEGIDAMRKHGGDANKAAKDIMDAHWDTWKEGAGQYYNAIKKWLDRTIRKLL